MAKNKDKVPTIRIECEGAATIGLPHLAPLQGELKTLAKDDYERLKFEILKDGFSFPFAVWENPQDAQIYILDGHQRRETLERMSKEGFLIPELPVVWVNAPDVASAKHKLLAAASQYGKMQKEGLVEFLKDTNFTAEDLVSSFRFPEIDILKFASEMVFDDGGDIGAGKPAEAAIPTVNNGSPSAQVRMVQLFFNADMQAEFLTKAAKIQEKREISNLTDTIMMVIREAFNAL